MCFRKLWRGSRSYLPILTFTVNWWNGRACNTLVKVNSSLSLSSIPYPILFGVSGKFYLPVNCVHVWLISQNPCESNWLVFYVEYVSCDNLLKSEKEVLTSKDIIHLAKCYWSNWILFPTFYFFHLNVIFDSFLFVKGLIKICGWTCACCFCGGGLYRSWLPPILDMLQGVGWEMIVAPVMQKHVFFCDLKLAADAMEKVMY